MGNLCQSESQVSEEENAVSTKIDQNIRQQKKKNAEIRLLLLGAGDSGKSTFVKQMRFLHEKLGKEELQQYTAAIHGNALTFMGNLLQNIQKIGLDLKPENKEHKRRFEIEQNNLQLHPKLAESVKALWEDPATQSIFQKSPEFTKKDPGYHYLSNITRISQPDYVPTHEDILFCRKKTSGVTQITFKVNNSYDFVVIDVGGQRSERRKWIHCFQDVTAILFFAPLSEYNQRLEEDSSQMRMNESLTLFLETCACSWFESLPIIVFYNKFDLFKEKIQKVDLKVCFPDYIGGLDANNALEFIRAKFEANNLTQRKFFTHTITAVDTENIRLVLDDVKNVLLSRTQPQ